MSEKKTIFVDGELGLLQDMTPKDRQTCFNMMFLWFELRKKSRRSQESGGICRVIGGESKTKEEAGGEWEGDIKVRDNGKHSFDTKYGLKKLWESMWFGGSFDSSLPFSLLSLSKILTKSVLTSQTHLATSQSCTWYHTSKLSLSPREMECYQTSLLTKHANSHCLTSLIYLFKFV